MKRSIRKQPNKLERGAADCVSVLNRREAFVPLQCLERFEPSGAIESFDRLRTDFGTIGTGSGINGEAIERSERLFRP
jgi:hypothetical protein